MNMSGILTFATQWKDFFWIIFTLVATATSVLTYVRVRKSIRQSLYNQITEIQIKEYAEMLEMLSTSVNRFLINCDVDNVIKFNILGHLTILGCLGETQTGNIIREAYEKALSAVELPGEQVIKVLEQFESVELHPDLELVQQFARVSQEQRQNKFSGEKLPGKYELLNIRGVFLNTEKSGEIAGQLEKYENSIYLPKRILKYIKRFHDAYLDFVLGTLTAIVHREENRVLATAEGSMVEINFAALYNEAMKSAGQIVREYTILKKEIRKSLKIDAKW